MRDRFAGSYDAESALERWKASAKRELVGPGDGAGVGGEAAGMYTVEGDLPTLTLRR